MAVVLELLFIAHSSLQPAGYRCNSLIINNL